MKGAFGANKEKNMAMLNLLASCAESWKKNWQTYALMLGLVAVIVVFMFLSSRSRKKREQETADMLNAIQPGNKVKTIGGICGIVVEVCPEDNTFVLETGTEASGKSYLKFDKQAIYQTDAGLQPAPVEDPTVVGETVEEAATEETAEAPAVEETAAEQPAAEEIFEEELKED